MIKWGTLTYLHFRDILGMKPPHLTFALHWINVDSLIFRKLRIVMAGSSSDFRKLRLLKKKNRIAVPFGSISEAIKLAEIVVEQRRTPINFPNQGCVLHDLNLVGGFSPYPSEK